MLEEFVLILQKLLTQIFFSFFSILNKHCPHVNQYFSYLIKYFQALRQLISKFFFLIFIEVINKCRRRIFIFVVIFMVLQLKVSFSQQQQAITNFTTMVDSIEIRSTCENRSFYSTERSLIKPDQGLHHYPDVFNIIEIEKVDLIPRKQ